MGDHTGDHQLVIRIIHHYMLSHGHDQSALRLYSDSGVSPDIETTIHQKVLTWLLNHHYDLTAVQYAADTGLLDLLQQLVVPPPNHPPFNENQFPVNYIMHPPQQNQPHYHMNLNALTSGHPHNVNAPVAPVSQFPVNHGMQPRPHQSQPHIQMNNPPWQIGNPPNANAAVVPFNANQFHAMQPRPQQSQPRNQMNNPPWQIGNPPNANAPVAPPFNANQFHAMQPRPQQNQPHNHMNHHAWQIGHAPNANAPVAPPFNANQFPFNHVMQPQNPPHNAINPHVQPIPQAIAQPHPNNPNNYLQLIPNDGNNWRETHYIDLEIDEVDTDIRRIFYRCTVPSCPSKKTIDIWMQRNEVYEFTHAAPPHNH